MANIHSVLNQKKEGQIVKSPRITEKATKIAESNVYTFNVSVDATKTSIKQAVKALYGVTPVSVRIVTIRQEAVFVRGKKGTKAAGKKAYVALKKGDTITLM